MAAGTKRLIAAVVLLLVGGAGLVSPASADLTQSAAQRPGGARRIVSLVPALTEMLFAIGAGSQVVGVGSFDAFPPEVKNLPRVGALLNPDVERILSLRPELVVIYGSQTDLQTQFARAGVKTYSYRHGGIDTILQSIRELGDATGHRPEADRVVSGLRDKLAAIRARMKGRAQPNVLLVIDRQPKTLREIYVSGGFGFLHEMLEIAGGRNVFSDVKRESVQPSHETLIARAPQVIVELQAEGMIAPSDIAADKATWSTLSSLPAVRNGRVHILVGQYLVVPGPRFADAVETLARTLHPEAFNRLR
jgi:iron complex transport system substrate-binding protein